MNNNALNATAYERWLTLSKGCIAVIPNALWRGTVRSVSVGESRQKRLRLGVPQNAKVVGSLMRFVEEKDPDLWLETALHLMRADNVKIIAGGVLANSRSGLPAKLSKWGCHNGLPFSTL